jgi:hypothetical protein
MFFNYDSIIAKSKEKRIKTNDCKTVTVILFEASLLVKLIQASIRLEPGLQTAASSKNADAAARRRLRIAGAIAIARAFAGALCASTTIACNNRFHLLPRKNVTDFQRI